MRPCNIFGERQKDGRGGAVIPIFTNNALQGKSLTIFGDGEQRREYMHVADVFASYDLVLNRSDLAGETLNCGTRETISIKEIAGFIAHRLGVAVVHGPARPGEIESFLLDSSKITSLGFRPRVNLWEGLERYVQWREELERDRVIVSAVGN